ncbi:MAG TPA: 3-hydroxyacyl-CoA dehydrogenase NAD-binding domain-containing protein [Chloroflexota bacterium]|nr:3-hydroxyacyl-CoA dehydrogenase NAD-binding domain-containing protein [Chloroflexota bacterium]
MTAAVPISNVPARPAGQSSITLRREDDIILLGIDVPDEALNVINLRFIEEFEQALTELEGQFAGPGETKSPAVSGLILHSLREGAFLAGADLKLIRDAPSPREAAEAASRLQQICGRLEKLPVTTVAAIDGAALGGGLEVALACDYRVAAESSSRDIGLVEVQLGLIPAGGGTQRLPRLTGLGRALALILTSRRLTPKQALRAGLVDDVAHRTVLMDAARALARRHPRQRGMSLPLAEHVLEALPPGRAFMYRRAAKSIRKRTGTRYPAPLLALAAIREGVENGRDHGLNAETRSFGRLAVSNTTRNLIDLFLDSNELKAEQVARGDAGEVELVGVVGAGLMGAGIAQAAAISGIAVRLRDVNAEAIAGGLKRIRDLTRQAQKSRRIDRYEAARVISRVTGSPGYSGFARAGLVIEAAPEEPDLKRRIVADLEKVLVDDAVIGTNTSAIPIGEIAAGAVYPERVVGIHFFSPVHRMPLVEVIRGTHTSERAVDIAAGLGRRLGKHVVIVNDGPGFYTTRVLGFMMSEAVRCFEEGASIEGVDNAMVEFGFPVGPMTLMDEVGLDVGIHVAGRLQAAFPGRLAQSPVMTAIAETGRKGKKSGAGFYRYEKGKRLADPELYLLRSHVASGGAAIRSVSRAEVQERLSLVFVNEVARCIDEGVVASARDADLAAVFGLGFPPFLGGPVRYADTIGVADVIARLRVLSNEQGARFEPARLFLDAEQTGTPLREGSQPVANSAVRGPAGEIIGVRDEPADG